MALINCPECKKQVSDVAAQCPDCGYPIYQASVTHGKPQAVTTIEQTDKKWKKAKIASAVLIIFGLLFAMGGSSSIGVWLMFAGIVAGLYGAIGGWWHHS